MKVAEKHQRNCNEEKEKNGTKRFNVVALHD
jgi:hypothetical protein